MTPIEVVHPRPIVTASEEAAPRRARVVVTETSIEIVKDIEFVADSTAIVPASMGMIEAMASTLAWNTAIKKMQVTVFIGDGVVADRDERARLAQDRANVIVEELVERGVDPERLVAVGDIDTPLATNPSWLVLDRDE